MDLDLGLRVGGLRAHGWLLLRVVQLVLLLRVGFRV